MDLQRPGKEVTIHAPIDGRLVVLPHDPEDDGKNK